MKKVFIAALMLATVSNSFASSVEPLPKIKADIDANRCRDLNVCTEVRSRGIEPSSSLNCPVIGEIGD